MRSFVSCLLWLVVVVMPASVHAQPTLRASQMPQNYSAFRWVVAEVCSRTPMDVDIVATDQAYLEESSVRRRVQLTGDNCVREWLPLNTGYNPAAVSLESSDGRVLSTRQTLPDPIGRGGSGMLGVTREALAAIHPIYVPWSHSIPEMAPELFPEQPAALQGLEVLVTTEPALGALSDAQRRAVDAWVETGGQLALVGPGSDTRKPIPRGLGGVTRLSANGNWPQASTFGQQPFRDVQGFDGTGVQRALIDRNVRKRPPLGTIAAILCIFVVLVGPVQFVLLRRRPLHSLWTFPSLAIVAVLANLAVGRATKGTTPRHDFVGIVKLGSDAHHAALTRVSGLFVTEAGPQTIRGMPGFLVRRLANGGDHLRARGDGFATTLTIERVPAGMWDTIPIVETGVLPIPGSGTVTLQRTPQGFRIENRTPWTLRDARLIWGSNVEWLGDLAPRRHLLTAAPTHPGRVESVLMGDLLAPLPWRQPWRQAVLFARLDPTVLPSVEGFERGRQRLELLVVEP